jgi:homoserine dehydrogenase
MIENGASFAEALRQAQLNGYAEQDPSADIEGRDACRKISILSDLCFGKNVDPEDVSTQGIGSITLTDVEYAGRLGCRIKLLGGPVRVGDEHITAYVAPHLLPEEMLLSHVDGVMNGIVGAAQRSGGIHVLRCRRGEAAHGQRGGGRRHGCRETRNEAPGN